MSLCRLATTHLMWAHLQFSYEIHNEVMYHAVIEVAQLHHQLESMLEDFHNHMSMAWHHLDNSAVEFYCYGSCKCCDYHQSYQESLGLSGHIC
jgi:hypothetical protein